MLHTLTCPTVRGGTVTCSTGEMLRVVRARTVSEAVLDLIATYMANDVRREVAVCSCAEEVQPSRRALRR